MKYGYRPGRIARSSVLTLLVNGLRLVTQLALLFLVARYLGPSEFGTFAGLAALALGLGTLSSFGLGFLVLGDSAKSPNRGKLAFAASIPATLLTAALLAPLYFWLCRTALDSDAAFSTLAFIGSSELLIAPLVVLVAQRMHGLGSVWPSQLITIIPIAMRLAGIIICTTWIPEHGLTAYATVYFLATAAGLFIANCFAQSDAQIKWFRRPSSKQLRRSIPYALMRFTAINPAEVDKAMALRLLSSADAGMYSLAARGLSLAVLPVSAMVASSQPRLFRTAKNDPRDSAKLALTVILTSAAFGILIGLSLAIAIPPYIEIFLGSDYVKAGEVLTYLSIAAPFLAIRTASGGVMISLQQPIRRASIETFGLIILLSVGTFWGVRDGYVGIIAAVVLSEFSMAALFVAHLYRFFQVPIFDRK